VRNRHLQTDSSSPLIGSYRPVRGKLRGRWIRDRVGL